MTCARCERLERALLLTLRPDRWYCETRACGHCTDCTTRAALAADAEPPPEPSEKVGTICDSGLCRQMNAEQEPPCEVCEGSGVDAFGCKCPRCGGGR